MSLLWEIIFNITSVKIFFTNCKELMPSFEVIVHHSYKGLNEFHMVLCQCIFQTTSSTTVELLKGFYRICSGVLESSCRLFFTLHWFGLCLPPWVCLFPFLVDFTSAFHKISMPITLGEGLLKGCYLDQMKLSFLTKLTPSCFLIVSWDKQFADSYAAAVVLESYS